jgi:hypothetical protein
MSRITRVTSFSASHTSCNNYASVEYEIIIILYIIFSSYSTLLKIAPVKYFLCVMYTEKSVSL